MKGYFLSLSFKCRIKKFIHTCESAKLCMRHSFLVFLEEYLFHPISHKFYIRRKIEIFGGID